jgi:hypothetical protein
VAAVGLFFMAVLLASPVQAKTPVSSALEDEALCDLHALRSLFMVEVSESAIRLEDGDAIDLNRLGFTPMPCEDGSRPGEPGPGWAAGCHFAYGVELSGSPFTFVAVGVSPQAQGLEFRMGKRDGLDGRDCQKVLRRRDPLWPWREVEAEAECCMRLELDGDPRCRGAIGALIQAYEAGRAREEFNNCPAARDLLSRAGQPPAQRLCGPSATRNERAAIARKLAEEGTLTRALTEAQCAPGAFHVSLPLLERGFARQCQSDECLTVLERAFQVDAAAAHRLGVKQARVLLPLLKARIRERRSLESLSHLLSALLGMDQGTAAWLVGLMLGEVSPGTLIGPSVPWVSDSPLLVPLLESARGWSNRPAASVAEVLLERLGKTRVSPETFDKAMAAMPCDFFSKAGDLPLEAPGRLAAVAAQADRCEDSDMKTMEFFHAQLARMAPSRIVQELAGAPCVALKQVAPRLGWEEAGRAEILFPWLAKQCGQVAGSVLRESRDVRLTPHLFRLAFEPETVRWLGGRHAVLQELLEHRLQEPGGVDAEVVREVVKAVATEPQDVRLFAAAWRLPLSHEELRELFQGPLRSPHAFVRAAVAAAMASVGASDIPEEAARACLGQMREYAACHAPGLEAAGPIPEPLTWRTPWCSRFRERNPYCSDRVCGDLSVLDERVRTVLSAVTGEESPDVQAMKRLSLVCVPPLLPRAGE